MIDPARARSTCSDFAALLPSGFRAAFRRIGIAALLATAAAATPSFAHHEAIFGPQSSLVLSAPAYVSIQAFTRRLGTEHNHLQETTALLSVGFSPWEGIPPKINVYGR
jgi:hypothetical protein